MVVDSDEHETSLSLSSTNDEQSSSSSSSSTTMPLPPYKKYKALYFFLFAAYGSFQPYCPIYFESLKFSKMQVGTLTMIPNMSAFFIAPLFGFIADTTNGHSEIMILGIIISTIITIMVLFTDRFAIIVVVVLLASSFRAPVTSLIDSWVISTIPRKEDYGQMRLFGALSYGIFSFISGLIVEDFKLVIFTHCLLMFASGFLILSIDRKYELKMEKNGTSMWDSIVEVFKRRTVQLFILIVFLSGFSNGVIEAFLFIRIKELGGSGLIMGISRSIMCAAEVPMFALGGYLEKKLGTFQVLSITQLCLVVRLIYYSLLRNPIYVFPVEVLHGFTFAVMWQVSCTYAERVSSKNNKSSIQSIIEGIYFGIGSGLGSVIGMHSQSYSSPTNLTITSHTGGVLYDIVGSVKLFEISAALSFISMLISISVSLVDTSTQDDDTHETDITYNKIKSDIEDKELEAS